MSDDVKELVARLQTLAGRLRDDDRPKAANEIIQATDIIKRDQKRISDLKNQLIENMKVLTKAQDALKKAGAEADSRALAAAEAMKEAAADQCDNDARQYLNEWNQKLGVADDLADVAMECAISIRALSASDVLKGI